MKAGALLVFILLGTTGMVVAWVMMIAFLVDTFRSDVEDWRTARYLRRQLR